jgi:uncharacterized damage-inducible protein DinB
VARGDLDAVLRGLVVWGAPWHRAGDVNALRPEASALACHFVEMARQNLWANDRLDAACACLSEEDRTAARTSFFGSIHRTLAHILIVDLYYVGSLVDGRAPYPAEDAEHHHPDFGALRAAQAASDRRLLGYCEALTAEQLAGDVVLVREAGRAVRERVVDVLPHLFLHQVHHRGQVHAMLSGTSVAPPQLDEFFLGQDVPVRAEELRRLGLPVR